MRKIFLFLFSLMVYVNINAQTTKLPYTRVSGDYIRPGGSFQHWGTTDWTNNFNTAPTIPSGNAKAMDAYIRLNWVDIESSTTQGVYSWTTFDQQFNKAMDSGQRVWLAVMDMCTACGLAGLGFPYGYPTYLHNLMQAETANSRDWQTPQGIWVPNWNSPNYIGRSIALWHNILTHMQTTTHNGVLQIKAFYNWDIRYYGDFGEGHTYPWTGTEPTGRAATSATFQTLCDSTASIFNNYLVTFAFGYQDNGHSSQIPLDAGYHILTKSNSFSLFGIRRDNFGDDGYNAWISQSPDSYDPGTGPVSFATLMMNRWKFAPWVGEPANDLNGTSRCGTVQCDLANEINLTHVTGVGNGNYPVLITDPTWGANMVTNIRNGDAIMGNKLVIDTSQTTTSPSTGGTWNISLWWKNLNVAPVYEKTWKPIFELRNGATVVWRDTSRFKISLFLPQATDSVFNDNFLLTGVAAGTYSLYVIIKDSTGYRSPYPLANTGRQADGSYLLRSSIVVSTSSVPTANAGADQTIALPTSSVTLDGSLSSGSITSFLWTKISGPNTPTIVTSTTITTSVTGLIQGTYVFQLAVNGGSSGSFIDQVTITVNPAPPPVANAGIDQNITLPTSSTTLDGSGSTGSPTTYSWTFVSGPTTPTIVSPSSAITGVTGLSIVGVYIFQLALNGGGTPDQMQVVVNSAPPPSSTIFSVQTPTTSTGGPDVPGGIELGVKFQSSLSGYIIGVRFYKTSGLTGTHTGELYSSTGTRLAQAIYSGETSTGWQTVYFTNPVAITAGTTFIAAMFSSGGLYVFTEFGLQNQIVNSPLTALADGASGTNGVFDYSNTPVVPTSSYHATNYWVDVIYSQFLPGVCPCRPRNGTVKTRIRTR